MANFDITISPAQLSLIIKPGTTITQAYKITNNSDSPVYLSPSIEPWQPAGEAGQINYQNVPSSPYLQFSLINSDISLNQPFALAPKSQKQLVLKIKTSPGSPLTDSYYTFFLSQSANIGPPGWSEQSSLNSRAKIGSHLLLSTSQTDQITSFAQVEKFRSLPRVTDTLFTPITLTAAINNLSDHFFQTTGQLIISKNNKILRSYTLFPHNVLAHHNRSVSCIDDQQTSQPCTVYPPLWPGRYTAAIELNPSISAAPATITFFVFPYYLTTILFLSTAVFFILSRLLHRHH